jgi:hypothetical protein
MPLLLYCVAEKAGLPELASGVARLPVVACDEGDIAAIFSESTGAESWTGAPLKESAREFHQVLRAVFQSRAVIPFRFPTLMQDRQELAAHLRERSPEYSAQLKKFQNSVQMDISITHAEARSASAPTGSGAEYLQTRQRLSEELNGVADHLQQGAKEIAQEWIKRPAPQGARAFALIDRSSVASFNERLKLMPVPPGIVVRVTGPWPVTEFLETEQS